MHLIMRQKGKFILRETVKSEKKFSIRDANCLSFSLNSSSLSKEKQTRTYNLFKSINK